MVRLFEHYVAHAVLLLGLIDCVCMNESRLSTLRVSPWPEGAR